jgi:hypothetical protein
MNEVTCTAESPDGIHFTRPELQLHPRDGHETTNIVHTGPGCHNFTPVLDTCPDTPPEHRYKALASAGETRTVAPTLVAFSSPDGYHWQAVREQAVLTDGDFDSQNVGFWDPVQALYVAYYRQFNQGIRDIKRATSPDFLEWSPGELLDYGSAPSEHLYTNAILPYFRAPHIHIGFPNRFVPDRKPVAEHPQNGVNDALFMSSRDGRTWHRWPEAFLRPAPDPLCWTDRNNYVAWGVVQTGPAEMSVYWNEHYRHATHRLRRGSLRLDGFVSLHGDAEGAELLTRPFTFSGRELVLNLETSAAGGLRVELCDAQGVALQGRGMAECSTVFGNETERVVSWKDGTDVGRFAGTPVRLRIRLEDADLYSIRFR